MGRTRPSALLSVIVPFYDVEPYLAEAVASLKAQTHPALDVILVDDGSTDGSLELARRLTEGDERFVVVPVAHGGLGAARNRGLERARGTYLTFMDADDIVPPDAYAAMVASLEASGSGMVLGNVERFDSTRAWIPGWARAVHSADVQGATLATLPAAMRDILACNRMYRRTFWAERVGKFPEGVVFEDHAPMLRSLLGSAPFDVLAQVTYRWRRREDGSSLSQPKDQLANLEHRARAKAEAWALLESEGTDAERALWLARVLDLDLNPYLGHGGTAAPDYQDLLARTTATYLEHAEHLTSQGYDVAGGIRGHRRLAVWYAAHRDWPALASLTADLEGGRPPLARSADGRLSLGDDAHTTLAPSLPRWLRTLPADALRPVLTVTRTSWATGELTVSGTLSLGGVRVGPDAPHLSATVGGHDVAVSILRESPRRPDAPRTGTDLEVRLEVATSTLLELLPQDGAVGLAVTLTLGYVVRDVAVVPGPGTRAPRPSADVRGRVHLHPTVTAEDGLVVRRTTVTTAVTRIVEDENGVAITLEPAPGAGRVAALGSGTEAQPLPGEGASWRLSRATLAGAVPDAMLTVAELAADRPDSGAVTRTSRVGVPATLRGGLPRGLAVSARAGLHAIPGSRTALRAIEPDDDGITLTFAPVGLTDPPGDAVWTAILREDDEEVRLIVSGDAPSTARIPVPRRAPGPADEHAPTVASCRLTLAPPGGVVVPLVVEATLLDALPVTAPSGAYDVRVVARKNGIEMRIEHLETMPPAR